MNYDRFYPCDFVNDKLALIFEENNEKCALIGTLGYKLSSKYEEALDMGIAAATATTASMFLGKIEKIYNIYNDIKDTK